MKSVVLFVAFSASILSTVFAVHYEDYMMCYKTTTRMLFNHTGVVAFGLMDVVSEESFGRQSAPCEACVDISFASQGRIFPLFPVCFSSNISSIFSRNQITATNGTQLMFAMKKNTLQVFSNETMLITMMFEWSSDFEITTELLDGGQILVGPVQQGTCFIPNFRIMRGMRKTSCRVESIRNDSEAVPWDEAVITIFLTALSLVAVYAHYMISYGRFKHHLLSKPQTDKTVTPGLYDLN